MVDIGDLSENMRVRSRDGDELGTIIRLEDGSILVEKGIFFLKDYLIPISLVTDVREGDVFLSVTSEELHREREAGTAGWRIADRSIRDESADFAHEGAAGGVGAVRTPDNLREGDAPDPVSHG